MEKMVNEDTAYHTNDPLPSDRHHRTDDCLNIFYVEMTSYLTSSKMPFTDEDGHLTTVFQNEKHDTARQLLKEYANRNWSRR